MAIYNTPITATVEASADVLDSGTGNRAVTTVIVCNTTGASRSLTLYAVAGGGTASASNMIVSSLAIPAGDTVTFDQEKMVLGSTDQIKAICSASGLTATVSTLLV